MTTKRAVATKKTRQTGVAGWATSNDLLFDISRTLQRLDTGDLDVEKAKTMATLYRVGASVLTIMLEHAKATKRLSGRQVALTGFTLK